MICANDILIVADKAEFKAFKVTCTKMGTRDVEMIQNVTFIDPHQKVSSMLSDKIGNQGHNTGHNKFKSREMLRKSLGMILTHTKSVLSKNSNCNWHLSAPSNMLNTIVSSLDRGLYRSLGIMIDKDLVNIKRTKLLTYFD